jgi:hypothetical protein
MAVIASLDSREISGGLATAIRTVREFDASDSLEAIRRTDVRRGIDAGREVVDDAAGAVIDSVARWQGRGQRRWRRPALVGLTIGIIGAVLLAAWWRRRRDLLVSVQEEQLDRDASDRAADEGMGMSVGAPTASVDQPDRVTVGVT